MTYFDMSYFVGHFLTTYKVIKIMTYYDMTYYDII